jgi:hypothetical protein
MTRGRAPDAGAGPAPVAAAPPPAPRGPLGLPVRVAIAATLVLLLGHAWIYRFLTDDAFISFRYARNLAHGFGLVFNPGHERVEGYSDFLWVMLLGALDRLGLAPERVAIPLGLILTVALWAVVVRAALERRGFLGHDALLVVPPLFLALSRSVAVWSTSGLETRAFELLVTGGTLRLAGETAATRAGREPGAPLGATLLGLAALTRPDGLLVGGCALGASVVLAGAAREPRAWIARVAPFLALAGGLEVFRLAYYRQWVPNTYFAKVGGRMEWGAGLEYVGAFVLEYAAFLWIPLAIAGGARAWRTGARPLAGLAAAVVLPHLVYLIAIGGDHFEYRPLGLMFPFAALLVAEGLGPWARVRAWRAALAAAVVLAGLAFLPWRSHVEFPHVYSSGFPGYEASAGPEAGRFLDPERSAVTRLPVLDAWARVHRALLRRITARFTGVRAEEHRMFVAITRREGAAIRALFERGWLPRDAYLATDCVGAIPYVSDARTLDRLGLTDAQVAHQPFASALTAHGKHATLAEARERGVDLWFDDPAELTVPLASSRFMRAWIEAGEGGRAVAFETGDSIWLLAEVPQGLDAARARFPRLRAWPLADSAARAALRPEAIAAWRARVAAAADDAEAFDALGYLLMEAGRPAEAVAAYRELQRLRPGDADAASNLAEAERRAARR